MKHHNLSIYFTNFLLIFFFSTHCFATSDMSSSLDNRIVKNINLFALDLFKQVADKNSNNLLLSPYSISSALMMVYVGATGRTKEQIAKALHIETMSDSEAHHELINSKQSLIRNTDSLYQLSIANAMWGDKKFAGVIKTEFQSTLQKLYGSKLTLLDFQQATEAARQTINTWVTDKTNGKIKELLSSNAISPTTLLILTNALYFKGHWLVSFDKKLSSKISFNNMTTTTDVPSMEVSGSFNYAETDKEQILELPYTKNSRLSMIVILPKEPSDLSSIELNHLSLLTQIKMKETQLRVILPKFKIESMLDLKTALQALKISNMFEENSAEFLAISDKVKLAISAVLHKTMLEVNEEGTEAAAATAVVMARGIQQNETGNLLKFQADHPFLFMVREQNGVILFMGKLVNPDL